jgi:hypothetical protein
VVSFTHRPLYPQGKSPWYPLDRRLGRPQSRSGRGGEDKNSQTSPGIEPWNHDRPARSPALYRPSYHGSTVKTNYIERQSDVTKTVTCILEELCYKVYESLSKLSESIRKSSFKLLSGPNRLTAFGQNQIGGVV